MKNDWTGSKLGIFSTMGATNHSDSDRQSEDYYATDPKAVKFLLEIEKFGSS